MKTQIVLVEDDAVVMDSVRQLVGFQDDMEAAGEFNSAEAYLEQLKHNSLPQKHIVLLDIGLPGMSGLEAISSIKELGDVDIIMLSTYEEEDKILAALKSGATSYISKRAGLKAILEGIHIVKNGGAYLSPRIAREIVNHFAPSAEKIELPQRQKEILTKLAEGSSYKEIAEELHISVETVRSHVKKMYRLLQVSNKTEAIKLLNNRGIR
ncbi:response regulator [Jiulongibacter sp. NS-SX5]|uniref:response regulator n=1 Tax=Jiulongibacter sp. NS-SX5 TaxID=3463854 RepID=UPI004059FA03